MSYPALMVKKTSKNAKSKKTAVTQAKKPAKEGVSPKSRPQKEQIPQKSSSKKALFLKRLLLWGVSLSIWGGIGLFFFLMWAALDLPDMEAAVATKRQARVTVLAENGEVITAFGARYGDALDVAEVPRHLVRAILATEDRRFYSHHGVDPIGLARAMWVNVRAGRIRQGGSTLTQQVAKNLFLTHERSFKRKAGELLLSFMLEHRFTKDQILALYMNRVYLGSGSYGVDAAAKRYYGISARDLSLYQAAVIAGLLKAPSYYNPHKAPDRADKRGRQVLQNMVAAGYLTQAEAAAVKRQNPISLPAVAEANGRYFADFILDRLGDYIGAPQTDVFVETTLDVSAQKKAEKAFAALPVTEQGAFVLMDGQGAIRAMVGGKNYKKSQFNRAVQAKRQPGSAFKPFVYLTAVEEGFLPQDSVMDEKMTIEGWTPRNYSRSYRGMVSLEDAFVSSLNTVSVYLSEQFGRQRVVKTARRFGLMESNASHPSLALGVHNVSLLDLTAAYAPFANGGYGIFPHGISRIRDKDGQDIFLRQGGGAGRLVAPKDLSVMRFLLEEVVKRGTGKKAAISGKRVGGKTGTSQQNRDAWFIGYADDLIGGVWVGRDNGSAMKGITGGGLPARLFGQVLAIP